MRCVYALRAVVAAWGCTDKLVRCYPGSQERNYELKYRRARAAVETMIDRAIPHLAPSGDQRMQDINDLVRSLGEPPVFRKVPCTPPAFA